MSHPIILEPFLPNTTYHAKPTIVHPLFFTLTGLVALTATMTFPLPENKHIPITPYIIFLMAVDFSIFLVRIIY